MVSDKKNMERLTGREKELIAIGAAIVSNCIPCIEYHIPQAKKLGLGDQQIREAIKLADKVRRVPADKVLQTADAILEAGNYAEPGPGNIPCVCRDREMVSEKSVEGGEGHQKGERVHLDKPSPEEDNDKKSKTCNDPPGESKNVCGSDKAGDMQKNFADKLGYDCSKIMQMMGECCPERTKGFSSVMADVTGECCPSEKGQCSEAPPDTKTES